MSDDAFPDEAGAPPDRRSRMRLIIGAGLMGMCLLGGMLHILPA